MKRYEEYNDIKDVKWAKYVIIVPTEEDRQELMEAFEHLHYSNIDTNYVAVNQLVHEYRAEDEDTHNNIVVNPEAFEVLKVTS